MGAALAMSGAALADTSQWTIIAASVDAGANGGISGVSCAGTTCWAVGGQTDIVAGQPSPARLEGNTGNGWFIAPDPSTNGVVLSAVDCVDADHCWAVGSGTPTEALIEEYLNGTWTQTPSPALSPPDPYRESGLDGISCSGLADCWAVGSFGVPGDGLQTLIEHYDGTAWTVLSSPNSGSDTYLTSVACPAANDCWAVGSDDSNAPFSEHYNGTAWSLDSLADVGPSNVLSGITCVSAVDCWTVGYQGDSDNGYTQTVIEQYDGTGWNRVASPNPIGGEWGVNTLSGVSCDTTGVCWAVGESEGVEGLDFPGQSLIAEYTGSGGWVAVTNPDPGLSGDDLSAVGCGIESCIAGGQTSGGSPLLAQGSLGQLADGATGGGSPPTRSSGTAGKGTTDPSVPDTGGSGVPWAPLLVALGVSVTLTGCRLRPRTHRI